MNQLHMHTMLLIGVSICAVKTDPIGYNASPLPSVVISIPVCQQACFWYICGACIELAQCECIQHKLVPHVAGLPCV